MHGSKAAVALCFTYSRPEVRVLLLEISEGPGSGMVEVEAHAVEFVRMLWRFDAFHG